MPAIEAAIDAARPPWLPQVVGIDVIEVRTLLQKHFVEYRVRTEDGAAEVLLVGKVYSKPERGAAADRLLRHLGEQGMHRGSKRVVRSLGWLAEWSLLLMEKAPGQPLHDRLLSAPEDRDAATLAARWLARLHATPAPAFLPERPARAEATLERIERELADALPPALAGPLHAVASALRVDGGGDPPPVLLHGDFHPRNLFVSGDGRDAIVTAIDVDHAARGDAAWDVGYLLGQTRVAARAAFGDTWRLDGVALAVRDEYARTLGEPDRPAFARRVSRFAALTLLEHLHYDRCILRKPATPEDRELLEGVARTASAP